jgi:hypothetical protein
LTDVFENNAQACKCRARVKSIVTICLLALPALPFIFFAAFSDITVYDDEGTVMITFRQLLNGRVLYHDISAVYGPFYYFIIAPLFSLFHIPLSHDATRFISATFWLCCSVTFATFAWRLTESPIIKAFALITALLLLKLFVNSALHPQELSFLLIGILLHLLVGIEKHPNPVALLLLGAIGGGLVLTKINLGAFIIMPLILGALRTTGEKTWLRTVYGIVLALALLMPVVLMAPLFRLEWVVRYCVFAEGTIIAALVVWSSSVIPKALTIKHWGFFLGGFAVMMLLTVGATIARGATASEILRATVSQNFSLVHNWYRPASISGGAVAIAAISVAYATFYALSQTRAANREAAVACDAIEGRDRSPGVFVDRYCCGLQYPLGNFTRINVPIPRTVRVAAYGDR